MPLSDSVKWTGGQEWSGALGFAGTTFTTVSLGTVPALTPGGLHPTLYVGWSSVLGAYDPGQGSWTPKLTLADGTVIPGSIMGSFQNAKNGAPYGGLYVQRITGDRLREGGELTFTFRLVNVLGSPTVTRDNGVVIGILFDADVIPTLTADGGYGDHGNVGRGPHVGEAGDHVAAGTVSGTFPPGALSDPYPWPVMAWVTRTENVSGIFVNSTNLTDWTTIGFFSSSAQSVAIACAIQEPQRTFEPNVQWDLGSDNSSGPWVVGRNWILTNLTITLVRGKSYAQIL